jgi:hypothetical protein
MTQADSKVYPTPPSLIKTLLAGFDVITNHIWLILFSISLDVLLWFGPQIRIKSIIQSMLDWMAASADLQSPEIADLMDVNREAMHLVADRFNLVSTMRTFPIGIPSLMVARAPVENPLGVAPQWQMTSLLAAVAIFFSILVIGIYFGSLYFDLLAQVTRDQPVSWRGILQRSGWKFLQVVLLSFFWLGILIAASIPLACLLPFFLLSGSGISRFILIFYGIVLIWLLLPMFFSPHGIFSEQIPMWKSVVKGTRLARFAMPSTGLFILTAILISQGMDILWNLTRDSSWLAAVSVVGHAFVVTSLIAASFIYYREANKWLDRMVQLAKISS